MFKGRKITKLLEKYTEADTKQAESQIVSELGQFGKPAVRLDAAGAIRYSDYNNYQGTAQCWEVDGAAWSFADVQQRHHDRYSQTLA